VRSKSALTGKTYPSKAECYRAEELRQLADADHIFELREQPRIELLRGLHYTPDFSYLEDGRRVFEDVKGWNDRAFQRTCLIWRAVGPALLRVLVLRDYRNPARGFRVVREELPTHAHLRNALLSDPMESMAP
jgi:hypothetical protein